MTILWVHDVGLPITMCERFHLAAQAQAAAIFRFEFTNLKNIERTDMDAIFFAFTSVSIDHRCDDTGLIGAVVC